VKLTFSRLRVGDTLKVATGKTEGIPPAAFVPDAARTASWLIIWQMRSIRVPGRPASTMNQRTVGPQVPIARAKIIRTDHRRDAVPVHA
jgi:hypothetical protein